MILRRRVALLLPATLAGLAAFVACVGEDPTAAGDKDPPLDAAAPIDGAQPSDASTVQDTGADVEPTKLTVLQVEAGEVASCAVLSDATVWCWGSNARGELGIAPPSTESTPPTRVAGLTDVKSISLHNHSACAVKKDGTVWCWGANGALELGRPNDTDAICGDGIKCNPNPTQVIGVFAESVAVGESTVCAITTTKAVMCWGYNVDGQCGLASTVTPVAPTLVAGISDAVRIKYGWSGFTTCAIDKNKKLWCWGKNEHGELGHTPGAAGDSTNTAGAYNPTPKKVTMSPDGAGTDFDDVVDIVASRTVCAVRGNGTVWCWGSNRGNVLNLDVADSLPHPTPTNISPIGNAKSIGIGNAACAVVASGEPWCWGSGAFLAPGGEAFDGGCLPPTTNTPTDCHRPGVVTGALVSSFDMDRHHAIGLTLDSGIPVSWGQNLYGNLGHSPGTSGDSDGGGFNNTVPTPVIGLP